MLGLATAASQREVSVLMETQIKRASPRTAVPHPAGRAGRLYRRRGLFAALAIATVWLAAPSPLGAQSRETAPLGATVNKSPGGSVQGTTFRVWAPNAESVSVIGTFNNWDGRRHAMGKDGNTGNWSIDIREAKPGDEYLYLINGELRRKDPRARQVTASDGNSVIYDTTAFDWGTTEKRESAASLNDLVIYQLHPGTFHDPNPTNGEPATLLDAIDKLDHLQDMGVNCVLLMPVNEFHGRHSWGYNPSDLFAIESSYGGPDALKEFVKACHERDIAVHVDIVHNHYGPQDMATWQFDGTSRSPDTGGIYFYEDDRADTPWGPRPNFGRPEVRDFIADQVRMWFDEYKIDGLRWDSVVNIRAYNDGADINPEGERMLHRLARMIRQEYPGKVSIAEDAVGDPRFDSSWDYGWHHSGDHESGIVPQLLKSPDAAKQVEDIASRIPTDLGFRRVIYTENHDETGRLNGNRRIITNIDEDNPRSLTAQRKAALAAVLTLTTPGVPLIFMGQELLEDKEFHDDNPLDWQRGDDAFHSFQLHRDLVHLRRNLKDQSAALTGTHARVVTTDERRKLIAFRRYLPGRPKDDLYVVINFSGEPVEDQALTFPKAGQWNVLLNTDDPKYGREFTGTTTENLRTDGSQKIAVSLAPYSAQIFGLTKVEPSVVDLAELRDEWETSHAATAEPETVEPEEEAFGMREPVEIEYEEVPFETDAKALVLATNFTEPIPMGVVDDHIWAAELGFTNGRNIQFRVVNPLTGREYGGTGLEPGVLPVDGTATEEGVPVNVVGPLNGEFILTFNERTLRYRFERKAATRFGRMNIMGNFNGWSRQADPLHMIDDHTWQADVELDPQETLEFVFLADGSLEKQWGDDDSDHSAIPARGTAAELAQTIKIATAAAGPHRFNFNEDTGEYSVEPLTAGDLTPLPAVPPPQKVTEIRRVARD
jgi:1,4-alpha-glucan branching enzyme